MRQRWCRLCRVCNGEFGLRKVSEYEQHAEECRKMAAKMKDATHKRQLEEMAEAWAMLARERQKQLQKQRYRTEDLLGGLQPSATRPDGAS